MWTTVLVSGMVGGLLGVIYGYPLERVLLLAGMCAGLMLALLVILRWRP